MDFNKIESLSKRTKHEDVATVATWQFLPVCHYLVYTAKNAQPVTMLMKTSLNNILLPYCSWLLTILFSINAEQQQQLTTRNNMGNKILFRPVFNNIVTGWAFLVVRWLFLWKTSLIYRFMSGILTQTKSETRIHIPSSFRTNYFG